MVSKPMGKRYLTALLMLISISAFAYALGAVLPRGAAVIRNKGEGPLVVDRATAELGLLAPLERVAADFTVYNAGDRTAYVDRITTTCGCTAAEISHKKIWPGASATLRVTIDASKFRGDRFAESATVLYIIDGEVEGVRVAVQGRIDRSARIVAIPGRLHFTVGEEGEASRIVTIHGNESALAVLPETIEYTGGDVLREFQYAAGSARMTSKEVRIVSRAGPDQPQGRHQGAITLALAGPEPLNLTMPVTMDIVPPIVAMPSQIFVAFTDSSGTIEVPVALRSVNGATPRIKEIVGDLPFEWAAAGRGVARPGDRSRVTLIFHRERFKKGIMLDIVTVELEDTTVEIPVVVVNH